MRYYYYPLCSRDFSFENIFSTESISPPDIYPRRGFGIDYFYFIPNYHHKDALILYNEPPVYDTGTDSHSIKFLLAISEEAIDVHNIIVVDEGIIAYQRTIYLNKQNFNFLFFSEREKNITILSSQSSLSTKGLKKYEGNFKLISEDECRKFEIGSIAKLNVDGSQINNQVIFDKRYNCYKGYIYGITIGLISSKTIGEIQINKNIKLLANSFAEFRNRFSNNYPKSTSGRYSRPSAFSPPPSEGYEKNLKIAIASLRTLMYDLFPGEPFSESKLIEFLQIKFADRLKTKEAVQNYLDYKIIDDEISGSTNFEKIKTLFLKSSPDKHPLYYLEMISQHTEQFIYNAKGISESERLLRDQAYDQFKEAIFDLNRFIENSF